MKFFSFLIFLSICLYSQKNFAQVKDTTFTELGTHKPAEFHNGVAGWIKYLQDSLNANLSNDYIVIPQGKKYAKATIIVAFTIDKEGNVSNVEAKKTIPDNVHPALIKEAIRVIEKGPKWIPATINGKPVFYRHQQSITFVATNE